MDQQQYIVILLLLAVLAANLPWLTERFLLVFQPADRGKRFWMRLLEWLLLYFIAGFIGIGIERKATGEFKSQDWEFYAVTVCLFAVFALPGFIYRHDLQRLLQRR